MKKKVEKWRIFFFFFFSNIIILQKKTESARKQNIFFGNLRNRKLKKYEKIGKSAHFLSAVLFSV